MRRVALGQSLRRVLLGSLATSVLAAAAAPALAAGEKAINLPAGPLEQSLAALSAQTGDQLAFPADIVTGRRAPALSGRYTTEQALSRLLAQEIEARRVGPRIIVLKPRTASAVQATPPTASSVGEAAASRPFADRAAEAPAVPPPPVAAPTPALVDEVTVTGTHLRGVTVGPSPVLVLDRDALERSGQTTVAGALQALPQNFAGAANEATVLSATDTTTGNSFYAGGVNLRGLGADATLVLVNGRRMGGSGLKGNFADVSSLPASAVERVEVLLDGASALYGADAVGGVVNVILKRRFDGAESRVVVGDGTAGGPFELQASQTLGHAWETGSLLVALEHYERDNLTASARRYTASTDLRPLGGTDHRAIFGSPGNILRSVGGVAGPGWAIPAGKNGVGLRPEDFVPGAVNYGDIAPDSDVLPRQVRESAYGVLNQQLGTRIALSADGRYSRRRFEVALNAPTSLLTVNTANPFFASPNGSTSHQIYYSFAGDLPLPRLKGSAESLGATAGLDVDLPAGWRVTGYGAFAQETSRTATTGILNSTALTEALGTTADRPDTAFSARRDGFFNPFGDGGDNVRAVLDFIGGGYSTAVTRARVTSADIMADGALFQFRGAPVRSAIGVNARKETYDRQGVSFVSGAAPTLGRKTEGDRDVVAVYGELRVPVVTAADGAPTLEASLAGRFERYSDFGETTNPKLGLVWTPHRDLRVRASYGTSFRAPALPELIEAPLNSPTFLTRNGVRTLSLIQYGGNPGLGPETARAFTGGFDLAPHGLPGLRISLNAFDIRFKDRIDQPVRVSISTALNDPTVASFISVISPATSPADLQRITALLADPATITSQGVFPAETYGAIVDARYVNTASLHVRGADVQAAYAFAHGDDHFDLQLNASYIADYIRQVTPTGPKVDRAGVVNAPPKLKVRATGAWRRDWWDVQVGLNYAPSYHDVNGVRLRSHVTPDLQLRAAAPEGSRLEGLSAILNVRNVFNRAPPFYDGGNGLPYDAGNADIIGRFVSLQLVKSW